MTETMVRKLKGKCEHGADITKELHFPLTAEILDMADEEDDKIELCVWLKSGEDDHVVPVGIYHCDVNAELVCDAMKLFLGTPEGQERARIH